jgi:hypothetical protein
MMQYIQQMMCWMSKMMSRMMSQKILNFLKFSACITMVYFRTVVFYYGSRCQGLSVPVLQGKRYFGSVHLTCVNGLQIAPKLDYKLLDQANKLAPITIGHW